MPQRVAKSQKWVMAYSKSSQLQSKPKKKRVRSERKMLVRKLDDIVRRICRARDKICCSCGKKINESSQVSHYVSRRHYALRWDLRNCHMSCPGCNLRHNYDPLPYSMFMVAHFGDKIFSEFSWIKQKHTKFSISQLQDLLSELEEKLPLAQPKG